MITLNQEKYLKILMFVEQLPEDLTPRRPNCDEEQDICCGDRHQ
jgi:hypothetical protein